jgi:ribosome-associated protein
MMQPMNVQQALQDISNRLDKARRKLAAAELREDEPIIRQFQREIRQLEKEFASVNDLKKRQVGSKADEIRAMEFCRELTKEEQADLGKLKKRVKGLVVVHPLTGLGREMGITAVMGFSEKIF